MSRHVLNDQNGRLVGVVVSLAECSKNAPAEMDRVARRPSPEPRSMGRRLGGRAVCCLEPEKKPSHPILPVPTGGGRLAAPYRGSAPRYAPPVLPRRTCSRWA